MEPPTDDDEEEGRSSEAKNILTAMPTFARSHTTHMLDAANKRTNQGSPRSLPALRPHAVHPSSAPLAGGGDRYVVVASTTGGLDHHYDGIDDHHHAARATAPLPQPAHDVVMGATGRQFTARHTAGLHSDGRATELGPTERKTMLNDRQYRKTHAPEASAPPSRRSSFSKMVPTLRSTAELSRMIFGRKDRAKAAVFGREAVLGGMTLTLAQLEEHDEHRSHILEQAFRPDTLRSLLTSFGTVMPDVLSSVFLWLSLGILAATISLRRLDVGRRQKVHSWVELSSPSLRSRLAPCVRHRPAQRSIASPAAAAPRLSPHRAAAPRAHRVSLSHRGVQKWRLPQRSWRRAARRRAPCSTRPT